MSIVFLISAAVFFIYFYFSIRKNKSFAFNCAVLPRKAKILGIFIIAAPIVIRNLTGFHDSAISEELYFLLISTGFIIIMLSKSKTESEQIIQLRYVTLLFSVVLFIIVSQIFLVFEWENINEVPIAHQYIYIYILFSWTFFFYFGKNQLSKNKKPEDL